MSDTTKAAYFLAALVAVFVVSWFAGVLAAPWVAPAPEPTPDPHETERHAHAGAVS